METKRAKRETITHSDFAKVVKFCTEKKDFFTTRVWDMTDLINYLHEKTGVKLSRYSAKQLNEVIGVEIKRRGSKHNSNKEVENLKKEIDELKARLVASVIETHKVLLEEVGVDFNKLSNLKATIDLESKIV